MVMVAFCVWRLPQRFQAFRHIGSVRQSIIITAEGRRFSFSSGASTDPLGRLTARGLLYECVYATPSFSSRRLNLLEARFRHFSARPPFGQRFDLP
jgi:hypothetical protein